MHTAMHTYINPGTYAYSQFEATAVGPEDSFPNEQETVVETVALPSTRAEGDAQTHTDTSPDRADIKAQDQPAPPNTHPPTVASTGACDSSSEMASSPFERGLEPNAPPVEEASSES